MSTTLLMARISFFSPSARMSRGDLPVDRGLLQHAKDLPPSPCR
jgi:hypothetical protein